MDELLQKAFERRDQLRQELRAVEHFIASYGATKATPPRPDSPKFQIFEEATSAPRGRRSADVQVLLNEATRIILQEGQPLSRSELLRRLEKSGHTIEGTDKNKVLGTNLWRSGKFYNLKGAGYWPKVSPIPQSYVSLPRSEGPQK